MTENILFKHPEYAKLSYPYDVSSLKWNFDFKAAYQLLLSKNRVIEESLENIFMLWINQFTGYELKILDGNLMWGGEDTIAIDSLGRIHLFEFKRDKISRETLKQIQKYLYRHVFQNPNDYILKTANKSQINKYKLLFNIVGIISNERIGTLGYEYVKKNLKQGRNEIILEYLESSFTVNRYRQLESDKKAQLLSKLLLTQFEEIKYNNVLKLAADWMENPMFSIINKEKYSTNKFNLKISPNYVYWLIAPSIDAGAKKDLNYMRSIGNDIRVLTLDIRREGENGLPNYYLKFSREDAEQRDKKDRKLAAYAKQANGINGESLLKRDIILSLEYYDKDTGYPLKNPKIFTHRNEENKNEDIYEKYLTDNSI